MAVTFCLAVVHSIDAVAAVMQMPARARVAEIAAMLPDKPEGLGPPCSDRSAWQRFASHPGVDSLLREAQARARQPIPPWSDEAYLQYSRNGSRIEGERMMGARRVFLYPLVIGYCLKPDDQLMKKIDEALLAAIADSAWTLPAHDRELKNLRGSAYDVDLVSSDYAHDLAQTLFLLGDRLSTDTRARVMAALERRIFAPMRATFQSGRGHSWLKATHNWNAVCLKGVTGAALSILPDKRDRALFAAVAENYIANYLESFTDDGYALEGPSYWNYGFSHYATLRELLHKATSGKVDLYATYPKSTAMALYAYRFPMHEGNVALFGDARAARPDSATMMLANEGLALGQPERRDSTPIPSRAGMNSSTVATASLILGQPIVPTTKKYAEFGFDPLRSDFESVGVMVSRAKVNTPEALSVTIKSGGNQNHSHDDIGSYAIAMGDAQPVGDPGATVYSAKSFSSARYDIKANISYGHPVPRIDGTLQRRAQQVQSAKPERQSSIAREIYTLDLRPAYTIDGMQKLERRLVHDREANSVTIADEFSFDRPRRFETAITSQRHSGKQIANDTWSFEHKSRRLTARIEASAAIETELETINEEGLVFQRLAIRLKEPSQSGFVRIVYQ